MDKNSFTAKSLPQGGPLPAATRAAPSFLVDQQAQMASVNNRTAVAPTTSKTPVLLAGGKPVKPLVPTLIQVQQAHDIIKLQELQEKAPETKCPAMEDLEPALVCLIKFVNKMKYSTKYTDDSHEYRHVTVPRKEMASLIREHSTRIGCAKLLREVWEGKLMNEADWRNIGVQQSVGWVHYAHHRPEPNILLFRRLKDPQPVATATSALSSKIEQIALE